MGRQSRQGAVSQQTKLVLQGQGHQSGEVDQRGLQRLGGGGQHRSCKLPEILTFGCTALILTHDKLFSMSQVTPILTNMYITHNNIHMAP
jgi:hypothetical protein